MARTPTPLLYWTMHQFTMWIKWLNWSQVLEHWSGFYPLFPWHEPHRGAVHWDQANHLLFNTAMSSASIKLMAFNSAHNTAKHIFSMQDTTNNTLTTCIHMILHVWSVCLANGISNAWCNSACWTLNVHYPRTSFLSCSSIGAFCSLNSDSEIAQHSNRECKFLICCK